MGAAGTACARCGEPLHAAAIRCGLCGSPSGVVPRAAAVQLSPAVMAEVSDRLLAWRDRYGTLPLLALVGVLPFFPVTPLVGIVAGGMGLHRISRQQAPEAGRSRALLRLVAGLVWLFLGIVLVSQAAEFLRQAPFVPAPLKWFWNWGVAPSPSTFQA